MHFTDPEADVREVRERRIRELNPGRWYQKRVSYHQATQTNKRLYSLIEIDIKVYNLLYCYHAQPADRAPVDWGEHTFFLSLSFNNAIYNVRRNK